MDHETSCDKKSDKVILTIGLAIYNGEKYIQGYLDSITAQTFKNFELIISDNASTDETVQIIKKHSASDSRIRVFCQPKNINLINNFNFLIRQKKKKYFMWSACDDRYSPDFLETIITQMELDDSIVLGFCPFQKVDETGSHLGNPIRVDNAGKNPIMRLIKFFLVYDDDIIYGIYRSDAICDIQLPTWWSKNRDNPYNTAYAFLTYVVSSGGYGLYGSKPLFYKLIKASDHYQPYKKQKRSFEFLVFFLLQKINLCWIQFKNIKKGASLFVAIIFIPVIVIRNIFDLLKMISNVIYKRIKSA